jgi:hypothetical protein
MDKHITLTAAFHIGYGVLSIVGAVFIWAAAYGLGFIPQDEEVLGILSAVINVGAFVLLFSSILGIVCAVGLLKRKSWARILTLIISAVYLVRIPIGTALGIYSMWTLLNEETKELFS